MMFRIGLPLFTSVYLSELSFGFLVVNPILKPQSAFAIFLVILILVTIIINWKNITNFFSKETLEKWDTFVKPLQRSLSSLLAFGTICTIIWGVVSDFQFLNKQVDMEITFLNPLTDKQNKKLNEFQLKGMHEDERKYKADSMQKVTEPITSFIYFDYSIVDSITIEKGKFEKSYKVPYRAKEAHIYFKKTGNHPLLKGKFQIPTKNKISKELTFY